MQEKVPWARPTALAHPAYESIRKLETSTPLQMADAQESRATEPILMFKPVSAESQGSLRIEAVTVAGLTVLFTAVFWMVISYIRSH